MTTHKLAIIALSVLLPIASSGTAEAAGRSSAAPVAEAADRTLELINRDRSSAGLPALTLDGEVTEIAAGWSPKMAADGALSHNADYLNEESMRRLNATRLGENVAYADSIDEIHSLFMNSPPHRANILHADYRQIGIAAVRAADGSIYLTEDFLTRRSATEQQRGEQSSAKKGPAGKSSAKQGPAGKSSARQRAAGKSSAKRGPAGKSSAKQAPGKQTPAKKAPAKKAPRRGGVRRQR